MSMSIDKTLDRISASIEDQEAKAVHAVRKFLTSIGMKEEFTDLYTVNRCGGGEWVIDTIDNTYNFASCDIKASDYLTLDYMRDQARRILTDEQLAEIGL